MISLLQLRYSTSAQIAASLLFIGCAIKVTGLSAGRAARLEKGEVLNA